MKKIVFMVMMCMFMVAGIASATDYGVTVGSVYDFNKDKGGVRIEASAGKILDIITPKVDINYIDNVYTRYGAGADVTLYKVGPVSFAATLGGVYQDSLNLADNGYGATAGVKVMADVTKNVGVTVGYERFIGEDKLESYNGDTVNVGVVARF